MWNPFSARREDTEAIPAPETLPIDSAAADPDVPRTRIAKVQMMGGAAVATLTVTELSQDEGAEQLADLLLEMSETGATNFVLDVQNIQFMDTTCLGCLVSALNRLSANGGQIAVASPNHSVSYVFRLTRLDRVFRICSDVVSALNAIEGHRKAG
jgi:anti-sigma B factor antagonist